MRELPIADACDTARERTDHAAALVMRDRLLAALAQSMQSLLGGERGSFAEGVRATLGALGEACGIHRVKVIMQRPAPEDGEPTHFLDHEWWAPALASQTSLGLTRFPNRTITEWTGVLERGRALWYLIDDVPSQLRGAFESVGVQSVGAVPIFGAGRYLGLIAFDDCAARRVWSDAEIAALTAAARIIGGAIHQHGLQQAMLAERDRRIAAEQARAEESAQLAERIERHAQLLAAVAASVEDLLGADDPLACIDAILARLSAESGAQRAGLNRFDWTPDDPDLLGWQEVTHEWSAPGAPRQMDSPMRRFPMRRDDATYTAFEQGFRATGRLVIDIAAQAPGYRSEQQGLGVAWSLAVPFLVEGVIWGALGFDYATRFVRHDEAELAALQTVASSIAEALTRQRLQGRALATERARADESARMARLLTNVVQSSRVLIDAGPEAFEAALLRWLGLFARETQAIRATFHDLVTFEATGRRTARMLCEWVREGVAGSIPVSFAQPHVIDPRDAAPFFERMMSGEVIALHADEAEGSMREFLVRQGNATVITVPVFIDGAQWGNLSFDFAERHALGGPMVAVLLTAADTLAAMIKRNAATRMALAEREARIAVEQRRFSELAHANDALRMSLDALADNEGEDGFLRRSLLQIHRQAGATGAWLFGCDRAGTTLRLLGRVVDGSFSRERNEDEPPMFRDGFSMQPELLARLVAQGRLLWRRVDPDTVVDASTPESIRWHLRQGHRANALHALLIGARQIGLVGMVFDTERPPSEAQQELIHTLCQPLTLALELARLADESRTYAARAAVQTERERMAAEIHDSLAQSFTSIAMQSESLAGLLADDDKAAVLRLIERTAREGLAQARMSVLALLPADGWPGSLDRSLEALAERSSIRGGFACAFEASGPPWAIPGAAQESLLRIAQEATSNAMRHSGGTQVRIRLDYETHRLRLTIEDDGRGLPGPQGSRQNGGFGITGMANRAAAIGGTVALTGSALGGLAVCVELPCPAAARADA